MNAIVVVDRNWAIGKDNALLFSLPTDMKRFRSLTLGGTVLLGRKTLDTFPGGRPLPGRRNIVLTRDPAFQREGVEAFTSLADALAAGADPEHLWVIGGGSVYTALLSRCKRVYLTKVIPDEGGRRRRGRRHLLPQPGQAARLGGGNCQRARGGERLDFPVHRVYQQKHLNDAENRPPGKFPGGQSVRLSVTFRKVPAAPPSLVPTVPPQRMWPLEDQPSLPPATTARHPLPARNTGRWCPGHPPRKKECLRCSDIACY